MMEMPAPLSIVNSFLRRWKVFFGNCSDCSGVCNDISFKKVEGFNSSTRLLSILKNVLCVNTLQNA